MRWCSSSSASPRQGPAGPQDLSGGWCPANQKGLYAAFSDTATGALTVIAGAVGASVLALGVDKAILLLGVLGVQSALACARLPEADRMAA